MVRKGSWVQIPVVAPNIMSNAEQNLPDYGLDKLRSRVMAFGLGMFACGVHSRVIFDLSENQEFLSNSAVCFGLALVGSPLLREYQDYRHAFKDHPKREDDDDDDNNGGGWDPDDDTPPNVPNDPGGIEFEWISEVEDFANSKQPLSV